MPATEDRSHPILNTDLDTEGPPDLYAVLSLTSTPSLSSAEIRSAYRKLALKFHPDKLPASLSESDKLAARHRFDQIGLAYKVLSDPARRARYDKSGRTDELDFLDGLEDEASWTAYFKDLWSGEVNARTIQEFTEKYRGSDEELNDLHAHYLEFDGSLEEILAHTMCATDACEPRLVGRIDASIAAGLLPTKPRWEREKKDTKARAVRRKNAAREAREAEELAKELGVHDKLFGGPSADSSAPKKGKHAARGAGKPEASEDALKALIQSKASGRHESLIAKLEAKALAETKKDTKKSKAGTKKRKATAAGQDDDDEEEVGNKQAVDPSEPTEEEFQQIQAQLDARRNKNQSSSAKPAAKSQAKGKKKAKTCK